MRNVRIAAAQLGPIQKDDSRQVVVARMIDLMDEAKGQGVDLIVYPELALTTFFPRWHYETAPRRTSGSSARCRTPRPDPCSSAPASTAWR